MRLYEDLLEDIDSLVSCLSFYIASKCRWDGYNVCHIIVNFHEFSIFFKIDPTLNQDIFASEADMDLIRGALESWDSVVSDAPRIKYASCIGSALIAREHPLLIWKNFDLY